ncbi:MAG: serine hydrolase [Bacteroidota bacterium]
MKSIRYLSLLLVASVALSCTSNQAAPAEAAYTWPDENWPVSTPEAEGVDAAAIEALQTDIAAGKYGLIDHFLLIRHGKVIADHHYTQDYESIAAEYDTTNHQYNYDHPAWHPYYQDTKLHTLQSVTKSITSAALGIAVDEGHLDGVESKPMAMFSGYAQDFEDSRRGDITLDDLLTMRSGIDWNEMISYDDATNSCVLIEASDNWIQFVLDQPMREAAGTKFDYNSGVSVLLGKLVGLSTGQRVDQWTDEKLFKPIGIKEYYWKITPMGEVDTEGGLYLKTHDLARIGYLFLRKGKWKDKQVISEAWVEKSTAPVVADIWPENGETDSGYGYQWWISGHEAGGTPVFAGNGYGGQFVIVSPEHDIVLVFNGWNIHNRPEMFTARAFDERILPAVKQD